MSIPTEPIGSIPRPTELIAAWAEQAGTLSDQRFKEIADAALRDTIRRFEETGSPVICASALSLLYPSLEIAGIRVRLSLQTW